MKAVFPRQIGNKTGVAKQEITVSFSRDGENFDNLFKDTIIEYRQSAGREEVHTVGEKTYKCTYLQTYASIGIPTKVYNDILKEANQGWSAKVHSVHDYANCKYTFVTADIDGDVACNIYSGTEQNITPVGFLYDVVIRLKSNVRGFGRFKVEIQVNGFSYLKFTLIGFQLVDKTNISSSSKAFVEVGISENLKKQLNLS